MNRLTTICANKSMNNPVPEEFYDVFVKTHTEDNLQRPCISLSTHSGYVMVREDELHVKSLTYNLVTKMWSFEFADDRLDWSSIATILPSHQMPQVSIRKQSPHLTPSIDELVEYVTL